MCGYNTGIICAYNANHSKKIFAGMTAHTNQSKIYEISPITEVGYNTRKAASHNNQKPVTYNTLDSAKKLPIKP